jgi:hypothetical protein
MKRLTSKQKQRIEEYLKWFQNQPNLVEQFDIDSLKMILKDGEYNPSVYSSLLNEWEEKYQSYANGYWLDDDGCTFKYGKDILK